MEDVDRLIAEAGRRGIRVLMDLVPNHTSDQHPWFLDSRSSTAAAKRDWYVWADPKPDGSPPNNWVSSFGGPAWTLEPETGQSYLHNHLAEQPDLNWWNEEVRSAFDEIMRFWCDRGVAGFRIDVANVIIKDALLRDNPAATEDDDFEAQMFGQRSVYNANRPEVHEVLRRFRALADTYAEPRLLIGETPVPVDDLARTTAGPRRVAPGLQLQLHQRAVRGRGHARRRRGDRSGPAARCLAGLDGLEPRHVPFPHPVGRRRPGKARAALLMLLCLRGHAGALPGRRDRAARCHADPGGPAGSPRRALTGPYYAGRDAGRTPMQWRDVPGGGFTDPGVAPWLPLERLGPAQRGEPAGDPDSMLTLARDLIALRRRTPDLVGGQLSRRWTGRDGVWAWRRGERTVVAVKSPTTRSSWGDVEGTLALGTDRRRDGEVLGSGAAPRGVGGRRGRAGLVERA